MHKEFDKIHILNIQIRNVGENAMIVLIMKPIHLETSQVTTVFMNGLLDH